MPFSINTDELRAVAVLARSGDPAEAARELNIATQRLTQLVVMFEHQIGVPMFVWNEHRVEVTEAGGVFVERAKLALHLLQNAVGQLQVPDDVVRYFALPPPLPPTNVARRGSGRRLRV